MHGLGDELMYNEVDIAEARVAPLTVVEALDVLLYSGLCIGPSGLTLMMYQLVFEALPEAFHRALS